MKAWAGTVIFLQSSKEEALLEELNKSVGGSTPEKVSWWGNLLQLLGLCIILAIILFAAYYTSRFIGRYKLRQLNGSNFEIIEMCRINANNMLLIVRITDRYMVLGVSKDNITYIADLNKDKILTREVKEVEKIKFSQILDKFKSKKE